MAFVTQEEVWVVIEYREHNESEWGSIATCLNVQWGVSITTVKDMFRWIHNRDKKPRSNKLELVKHVNWLPTMQDSSPLLLLWIMGSHQN
jgi:hypothetical protein